MVSLTKRVVLVLGGEYLLGFVLVSIHALWSEWMLGLTFTSLRGEYLFGLVLVAIHAVLGEWMLGFTLTSLRGEYLSSW